jgi:hypothetical protein
MHLTEDQRAFFDCFGYLVLRGALRHEMTWIDEEFERQVAIPGRKAVPFIDQSERLSTLLDHPAIVGAAGSLLGEDFSYMSSDGGLRRDDSGWHSDGHWRDHGSLRKLKFLIYLDVLGADSGCLRVIPGSHRVGEGFAEALESQTFSATQGKQPFGIDQHQWPNVALETRPGDVVVFNQHLKHAAFFGGIRRRLFTIIAVQRATTPHEIAQLRGYMAFHLGPWVSSAYGQPMLATADAARMRHLRQGLEHEDVLAPAGAAAHP